MPHKTTKAVKPASPKVPKTYRLSEAKIAAVKEVLGAATATEAIETALDMVLFRKELVEGTRAMLGTELQSFDAE
jgi:hypothetical protein